MQPVTPVDLVVIPKGAATTAKAVDIAVDYQSTLKRAGLSK
jgi:hypothetical protein